MQPFFQGPEGGAVLLLGMAFLLAIVIGLNLRFQRDRNATALEMQRLVQVAEEMAQTQADLSQRFTSSQADLSGRL